MLYDRVIEKDKVKNYISDRKNILFYVKDSKEKHEYDKYRLDRNVHFILNSTLSRGFSPDVILISKNIFNFPMSEEHFGTLKFYCMWCKEKSHGKIYLVEDKKKRFLRID